MTWMPVFEKDEDGIPCFYLESDEDGSRLFLERYDGYVAGTKKAARDITKLSMAVKKFCDDKNAAEEEGRTVHWSTR